MLKLLYACSLLITFLEANIFFIYAVAGSIANIGRKILDSFIMFVDDRFYI